MEKKNPILDKWGGVWTIGDDVVNCFKEIEEIKRQKEEEAKEFKSKVKDKKIDYEDYLGSLPDGIDNKGNIVVLAKHHVIPKQTINEQIGNMVNGVEKDKKEVKKPIEVSVLKKKLQHILNNPEIQREFDVQFANITDDITAKDVAVHLRDHITWYPENLFIGPKGDDRSEDPGCDDIDNDILDGLQCSDENAFSEFNFWTKPKGELNRLQTLEEILRTTDNTIIDVFLSLNRKRRNTKGPLWKKQGKGGKWVTNKSWSGKTGNLVLKDLIIPFPKKVDDQFKKVNIENGKSEGYREDD